MIPAAEPVERVCKLSPEDFHAQYLAPERPVVVTDQTSSWPAAQWTVEQLVRRFGDRPIRAYHHPDGIYTAWKRMRVDTTLGAVLSKADPRTFISSEVMPECPYLMPEFDVPQMLRPEWLVDEANVWIQPHGNRTGLHWDSYNSVISLLRGEKRVLMFSPEQYELLYPCRISGPSNFTQGSWSRVDVFAPDYAAFPGLQGARVHEVRLRAGETLLIPRHWWHAVENLGTPTMAISFFVAPQGKPELTFYEDRRMLGALAMLRGQTHQG